MPCCRNFDFLISDAPELIAEYLEGEQDMSCKRNAFMMLIHADQVRCFSLCLKHNSDDIFSAKILCAKLGRQLS